MSEFKLTESVSSSPESSSGSPGAILRRCREFHGFTLEEASGTTKIGVSYLKALEDDQIQEFANQAYLKGFLRIYATYLGLSPDDIARMYDKLFGVQKVRPDSSRISATPQSPPRSLATLKKFLIPAFLLALILVTATFFKRIPASKDRQPHPAVVAVPSQIISAVQMAQSSVRNSGVVHKNQSPKEETSIAEPSDTEKTAITKRPAETAKGFILKIKVTQNGTLTSTVDGSVPQQYELNVGDVIEWKAQKKVTLELSDAGGVDIELNGKPYKSLGPPGKPIYVELDAEGVKQ